MNKYPIWDSANHIICNYEFDFGKMAHLLLERERQKVLIQNLCCAALDKERVSGNEESAL